MSGAGEGMCVIRHPSETYYARPPQIPSTQIRENVAAKLRPSFSAGKKPTADSNTSASRIKPCKIAGRGRNRGGNGGIPSDMDERERNTVVW
jgi:hypothetical protein